jgi:hypothetical protein
MIIIDCRKAIAAKDALVEQQYRQLELQKVQLTKTGRCVCLSLTAYFAWS